jgi:hypothetical protein
MNAMAGVLIIGLLGARSVGHGLKTASACFGQGDTARTESK